MTDFTRCTATELADLYRTGSASPVTVAEQVLAKIEQLNPVLNAFCFTDPDTTISQARASQQRWASQQPLGELDGVPVAIKDSILTKGFSTLNGSHTVVELGPQEHDGPIIVNLKQAGAIIVGKTNVCEFNHTAMHSDSPVHGKVINPVDHQITPGGSSGGSAVAVSANMVPLAIGTDMGGSISVPASFCETLGFKPSFGRIPMYPSDVLQIATVGVFARSVVDIKKNIISMSAHNTQDCSAVPYSDETPMTNIGFENLRVGYLVQINQFSADQTTGKSADKTASWLHDQGAKVEQISLDIPNLHLLRNTFGHIKTLHQWNQTAKHLRLKFGEEFKQAVIQASRDKPDLHTFLLEKNAVITRMYQLMQNYDILISPVTTVPAQAVQIQSWTEQHFLTPWSVLYGLSQQPSLTMPLHLNGKSGSVLIAGARNMDLNLLQIGQRIEFGITKT